jgi:hypothetical protein
MRPTRLPVPFLVLLSLSACGEGVGASAGPVTRDSAGIQIVENAAPLWKEGQEWKLSAEPELDIGEAEGAPESLLGRVRTALRRSDGTLVVANGGTQEIRFYEASGRYLRAVGREGEGPGEFRSLDWLALLPGDSLLAYDQRLRRLSVFSPEGAFVQSSALEGSPEGGLPHPMAAFADGSLLVKTSRALGSNQVRSGPIRSPVLFSRYSAVGEPLDSIAVLPGDEGYVKSDGPTILIMSLLLGRSTGSAVSGNRVYLGSSDAFQIGLYSPSGQLERLIRRRGAPRPVTDEDVRRLREQRIDAGGGADWQRQVDQILQEMPIPETRPAFAGFKADDDGNLWVRETTVPGEPALWTVFDTEGRMLGSVRWPDYFRPTHIGRDFVVGIARDELDVEHVLVYGLEKPA